MQTELGKIESIELQFNDGRFGFHIVLSGIGWGVNDNNRAAWGPEVKWCKNCGWTEEERLMVHGKNMLWIADVMLKAKVTKFSELKGKPVSVVFDDNSELKSWRILEEVL